MARYVPVFDDDGFELDENGFRVLPDEPKMSKVTGKRRKAQPKVLTDGKINKICRLIREGNFVKQACVSAGVNYETFRRGMAKGKKLIRPYDEWYEQVEMAKAQSETDVVKVVHDAIEQGNVGVAQWYLARKFPNRWEKTERIKAKVDNSQKIEIVRFSDKVRDKKEEVEDSLNG